MAAPTHAAESASQFAAPKPRWATQNSPCSKCLFAISPHCLSLLDAVPIASSAFSLPRDTLRVIPSALSLPPFNLSVRAGSCHRVRRWFVGGSLPDPGACDALGLGEQAMRFGRGKWGFARRAASGRRRHVCGMCLCAPAIESCVLVCTRPPLPRHGWKGIDELVL